jgi:hypothetical protein
MTPIERRGRLILGFDNQSVGDDLGTSGTLQRVGQ